MSFFYVWRGGYKGASPILHINTIDRALPYKDSDDALRQSESYLFSNLVTKSTLMLMEIISLEDCSALTVGVSISQIVS